LKDVAGFPFGCLLLKIGIIKPVFTIMFQGLHKIIGDGYGDVEVVKGFTITLHGDEFFNIGMINPQETNISAAPGSALFDSFSGGVNYLKKRDRP